MSMAAMISLINTNLSRAALKYKYTFNIEKAFKEQYIVFNLI